MVDVLLALALHGQPRASICLRMTLTFTLERGLRPEEGPQVESEWMKVATSPGLWAIGFIFGAMAWPAKRCVGRRTNEAPRGGASEMGGIGRDVSYFFSVASRPSRGAPVPDEPANSRVPSGNVTSRPFARFDPSSA